MSMCRGADVWVTGISVEDGIFSSGVSGMYACEPNYSVSMDEDAVHFDDAEEPLNLLAATLEASHANDFGLQPAPCNPAYSAAVAAAAGHAISSPGCPQAGVASESCLQVSSSHSGALNNSSSSVIEAMSDELCQQLLPSQQMFNNVISCRHSLPLPPLSPMENASSPAASAVGSELHQPAQLLGWQMANELHAALGSSPPPPAIPVRSEAVSAHLTAADVFDKVSSSLDAKLSRCSSTSAAGGFQPPTGGPASPAASSSSSSSQELLVLRAMLSTALNAPAAAAAAMAAGQKHTRRPQHQHSQRSSDCGRALDLGRVQKRLGHNSSMTHVLPSFSHQQQHQRQSAAALQARHASQLQALLAQQQQQQLLLLQE